MSDFDLNMIRTFCVLYELRGVTRAAEELHLTQPTVSHTLKNLRRQFRDELFVRSGRFLEPTGTAHRLYPGLKGGLTQILETSDRSALFVPKETRQNFTLWLSDLGDLSFLPLIVPSFNRQAPNAKLIVETLEVSRVAEALVRGDIDGAILTPVLETPKVERTVIRRDDYVVIASVDHPRIKGALTLEQYAHESHVRMTSGIGHNAPEDIADHAGVPRRDVLQLSRFTSLPTIIQETESLAVVPGQVASQLSKAANLQVLPYPLPVPPMEVSLYNLPANRQSEAQRWFSNLLKQTLKSSDL